MGTIRRTLRSQPRSIISHTCRHNPAHQGSCVARIIQDQLTSEEQILFATSLANSFCSFFTHLSSQSDSSFLLKLFKIVENRTDIVLRMLPTDIYLYQCISFNCVKTNKKHKTSAN